MSQQEVTICLIGDTGAGKSSFGNYYLGKEEFAASDSTDPVTLEAFAKSNEVEGCKRWVIDTEGLNDGQSINAVQIQNLAKLMRNYERGVNAITIALNGQYDRFSQGVKDIIKFAYNAFGTKEALNHICIVFTKCYDTRRPNRETKRTMYKEAVRKYLSEVSGIALEQIPEIPIFFVDCYPDDDNEETKENMIQFHGWVVSREPLDTKQFKEAGYREDRIEETRNHFSVGTEERDDTTYEIFEDQKRMKIVPNNQDPPRYSEWECINRYEEPIKKVIIEENHNVDLGYQYSDDLKTRYKVTVDQERKIIRDLRTGENIEVSPWYNSSEERRTEAGHLSEEIQTRNRIFERKEVEHHRGHGVFGGKDHTHYKIFHTTYQEQRINKYDYDGNKTNGKWFIVPGTLVTTQVGGGEEGGHTEGYDNKCLQ